MLANYITGNEAVQAPYRNISLEMVVLVILYICYPPQELEGSHCVLVDGKEVFVTVGTWNSSEENTKPVS